MNTHILRLAFAGALVVPLSGGSARATSCLPYTHEAEAATLELEGVSVDGQPVDTAEYAAEYAGFGIGIVGAPYTSPTPTGITFRAHRYESTEGRQQVEEFSETYQLAGE